jgi:hypothetical protein
MRFSRTHSSTIHVYSDFPGRLPRRGDSLRPELPARYRPSADPKVEFVRSEVGIYIDRRTNALTLFPSIVAVHGLNPTNNSNHAEATWTAKEKLWLRDFLPVALPNARILLFGYNANVAFETSTAGVVEHAINLLNRLNMKRKGVSPDRPIIFIAHSLGGILVKRVQFDYYSHSISVFH